MQWLRRLVIWGCGGGSGYGMAEEECGRIGNIWHGGECLLVSLRTASSGWRRKERDHGNSGICSPMYTQRFRRGVHHAMFTTLPVLGSFVHANEKQKLCVLA